MTTLAYLFIGAVTVFCLAKALTLSWRWAHPKREDWQQPPYDVEAAYRAAAISVQVPSTVVRLTDSNFLYLATNTEAAK